MLKKISLLAVVAVALLSLASCGGGAKGPAPDAEIIPVAEFLIPTGVSAETQDSQSFYQTTQSLEELQTYYRTTLETEGKLIAEKSQQDFVTEALLPEQSEESMGTVVWGVVGNYGTGKTPVAVTIAEQDGNYSVAVGVGYRGKIMAQGLGIEIPVEDQASSAASASK